MTAEHVVCSCASLCLALFKDNILAFERFPWCLFVWVFFWQIFNRLLTEYKLQLALELFYSHTCHTTWIVRDSPRIKLFVLLSCMSYTCARNHTNLVSQHAVSSVLLFSVCFHEMRIQYTRFTDITAVISCSKYSLRSFLHWLTVLNKMLQNGLATLVNRGICTTFLTKMFALLRSKNNVIYCYHLHVYFKFKNCRYNVKLFMLIQKVLQCSIGIELIVC